MSYPSSVFVRTMSVKFQTNTNFKRNITPNQECMFSYAILFHDIVRYFSQFV